MGYFRCRFNYPDYPGSFPDLKMILWSLCCWET